MKPWFDVPVFNWLGGQLTTIYVGQYIWSAQQNFPEARRLAQAELEALDVLDTLADDPALRLVLVLVQTAVWKTAGDRSARAKLLSLWKGIVEHYGGPGASVR